MATKESSAAPTARPTSVRPPTAAPAPAPAASFRAIVLGGAGDVGSKVVEYLAAHPACTHVTVADRNVKVAEQVQSRALTQTGRGKTTVSVAAVDAFNHASLVAAIGGHDVCASALGPFHLFEVRCAKASIEAGVRYCSVCDDWNAAEDVIEKLNDAARSRGLVCVTGFGATPGVSNMGATLLMRQFERPTSVKISCFQPLNAGGGEAVLRHMLFVMTGKLPVWRNGRRELIQACGETLQVELPKVGVTPLWHMGHAEPVTMHRYFPTLRHVEYRMGFGWGSRCLVWPAWLGLFHFKWIVNLTVWIFGWIDWVLKRFPKGQGSLRVDVTGERADGSVGTETLVGFAEMRESTGISLAVGATLLGTGQGLSTTEGGMYAPEGAVDPVAFLRIILSQGFVAYKDTKLTQRFELDPV